MSFHACVFFSMSLSTQPTLIISCCLVAKSCPTLLWPPWTVALPPQPPIPGSSVYEILQARVLEWVAISFSRGFPDPGTEPSSPALAGFFTTEPSGKPQKIISKDPINTSELGGKKKDLGRLILLIYSTFSSHRGLPGGSVV